MLLRLLFIFIDPITDVPHFPALPPSRLPRAPAPRGCLWPWAVRGCTRVLWLISSSPALRDLSVCSVYPRLWFCFGHYSLVRPPFCIAVLTRLREAWQQRRLQDAPWAFPRQGRSHHARLVLLPARKATRLSSGVTPGVLTWLSLG